MYVSAQKNWQVQPSSGITFKIKNAGFTVNGTLKGLKAEIRFSPDEYAQSSIQASVDVNTMDTGIEARDKHLKKSDYFDASKYPQISMKSKRIAPSKSGDFIGYFTLTIKGTDKEVTVPFKFVEGDTESRFEGSFKINRRDFKVGSGSLILSDTVEVFLKIVVKG